MGRRMKPKEFAKFLERDGYCLHCGETEAIAPNHRINRGMGGSKLRDNPANIVILCSMLNGLIESDQRYADMAKSYGWKLDSWQLPEQKPVFDTYTGFWLLLDNDYGRKVVNGKGIDEN